MKLCIPDDCFDRCRIVTVARIVELWAIRNEANHIALGDQFDVAAWRGNTVFKGEFSCGCDGHIHEEVNIAGDVALAEIGTPVLKAADEAVAAGMHVLFIVRIAHRVAFARAGAPECIMPTAGIGGNG